MTLTTTPTTALIFTTELAKDWERGKFRGMSLRKFTSKEHLALKFAKVVAWISHNHQILAEVLIDRMRQ
jgi:hypothetical protein